MSRKVDRATSVDPIARAITVGHLSVEYRRKRNTIDGRGFIHVVIVISDNVHVTLKLKTTKVLYRDGRGDLSPFLDRHGSAKTALAPERKCLGHALFGPCFGALVEEIITHRFGNVALLGEPDAKWLHDD